MKSACYSENVCLLFLESRVSSAVIEVSLKVGPPAPVCVGGAGRGSGAFRDKSRGWESGFPGFTPTLPSPGAELRFPGNLEVLPSLTDSEAHPAASLKSGGVLQSV